MTLANPIEAFRDGEITIQSLLIEIDRVFAQNNADQQKTIMTTIKQADIVGALKSDDLRRITDRVEAKMTSIRLRADLADDDQTHSMRATSRPVDVGAV